MKGDTNKKATCSMTIPLHPSAAASEEKRRILTEMVRAQADHLARMKRMKPYQPSTLDKQSLLDKLGCGDEDDPFESRDTMVSSGFEVRDSVRVCESCGAPAKKHKESTFDGQSVAICPTREPLECLGAMEPDAVLVTSPIPPVAVPFCTAGREAYAVKRTAAGVKVTCPRDKGNWTMEGEWDEGSYLFRRPNGRLNTRIPIYLDPTRLDAAVQEAEKRLEALREAQEWAKALEEG